jgi:hypothetical protein
MFELTDGSENARMDGLAGMFESENADALAGMF